jgi:enoyl-CoA hydratase/carnithine racemase
MDRTVVVDLQAPVATVTVDRPRARNALSSQVLTELLEVCSSLGEDPAVAGVVLTGAPGPARRSRRCPETRATRWRWPRAR